MLKRFSILSVLLFFFALCSWAQPWDVFESDTFDEEEAKWDITVTAGVNSDGYECDLSFGWYPIPSLGFKIGLGAAGEIDEISSWEYDYWYDDYLVDYVPSGPTRFKFMPSIMLRSPVIFNSEFFGGEFRLFANPGAILSPGYKGTYHAQWASWMVRAGLELSLGPLFFQVGYGASNYNLYSGDPAMDNNQGFQNRITHTGFLSIGGRF